MIILRRPAHAWPLVIGANRDEMANRPWQAPARHWPAHPGIVAGRDELANGTWLGLNDHGVMAAVLNRINTLGPAPGFRSRGELPLIALQHHSANAASEALRRLQPAAYRPFNMIVADRDAAFWIRVERDGGSGDGHNTMDIRPVPDGLSMITAYDLDDRRSPRVRRYLPQFRQAVAPEPGSGDWAAWRQLLADRSSDPDAGPGGAMTVATGTGFGTVCSALIAFKRTPPSGPPIWLFAPGPPDRAEFAPVAW